VVHELSRRDARRIAVRAQVLSVDRPNDLLAFIKHVTLLQVDMTAAVAPNVDLVSWSRLGVEYEQKELDDLIQAGSLVEFRGVLRPSEDIALFRAEMSEWPGVGPLKDWQVYIRDWVGANSECRADILQRLKSEGPLPARELDDTCAVPWRSTGWTNNRNVLKLLDFMEQRGEVAVSSRENRERVWDLAERIYPNSPVVPLAQARAIRDQRRLASLGIGRSRGPECPVERQDVGEAGEPAAVEGVRGTWRVDADQLGQPFRGRAALLSPLDRLVVDRKRLTEIFEFDYQLGMYKPVAKRRWGYFALPILYGDRLVGKLDAASDFEAGVLRVNAIHRDVEFTKAMTAAVDREIRSLAQWLGLKTSGWSR
jgi:uncharacterized protein YcaQ